jgi:uncharacterized membrane protein
MSELIVITFDNPDEAGQVAATFRQLHKDEALHLKDMRVVAKDAQGNVSIRDRAGHPIALAAVAGGVLGGLLFAVAPLWGVVIGAAGGAAFVKSLELDIDKDFIQEVGDALGPNTSAVFILGSDADHDAVVSALKPYKGKVLETTLTPDMEEQLQNALAQRSVE